MATKWSIWLIAGLVLAGRISAWGSPTGINVLSQEHHVWGSAGSATQFYPGGTEVSYNQTSSGLLDISVTGTYMHPSYGAFAETAGSRAGGLGVGAWSVYRFAEAYAQSTYLFTPQARVGGLSLQLSGSGYGAGLATETNVRFALDDLTAGTSMLLLVAPGAAASPDNTGGWNWPAREWSLAWNGIYPVDPTHLYALTLFAYAGAGDAERGAFLDANVTALVPAPGALLLAALGAVLVGWRRRSIAR